MITETKLQNKIKYILLNYDLLDVNSKQKIDNLYQNKNIKINDRYLHKFREVFKIPEIEHIFNKLNNENHKEPVIYFSMEFGISDLLPNYSGGLGILAGDHLKQSSESNLNIIGIGLFYKYAYFYQKIIKNKQEDKYEKINIKNIVPEKLKKQGKERIIKVKTDKYEIFARIWKVRIGNNSLLLLDTDLEENNNYIRRLTDKLYGGNREKRLLQEILLGIGGMKLIRKLKIKPAAIHINEGHSAFALLENTRRLVTEGMSFEDAFLQTKAHSLFTTHTPVIHGNEEFEPELINKHMSKYLKEFNLSPEEFIKNNSIKGTNKLMMTVLAIKSSSKTNAVSRLHSETAQDMWKDIADKPILPITNGIHISTWMNSILRNELESQNGNNFLEKIDKLPDEKILEIRNTMKIQMLEYINTRYHLKIPLNNRIAMGFARRFAPYKRADLLFLEMHRIKRIFKENNLLMFIAGKAHPNDTDGKAIINRILNEIDKYNLNSHIIFLNNYDIELAKRLTSGCDLWLNTPLKPMEASGTSGMKSALNGGLNLSIADGWWAEAYNGKNGFKINELNAPLNIKNIAENNYLLNTLEYEAIPVLENNTNQNNELFDYIRNSMKTIHARFSAERMLNDYMKLYNR